MNITQIYTHPSRYKPRGAQAPVAIILHEVNEPLGALGARVGTNLINALKPTAHQSYHYALDGAAVHAFVDPAQAARALGDTEILTGWSVQAGFVGVDPDKYTINIAVIVGSAPIGDNLCIPCCGREYSPVMMWNLRRLIHQLADDYEIDVSGDSLWLHGDELCDICLDDLRVPPEVVTPGEEDWLCDRLGSLPEGDNPQPRMCNTMVISPDCEIYPLDDGDWEIYRDGGTCQTGRQTPGNTASGPYSVASGNSSIASGSMAHAQNRETLASGFASHAEGSNTIASGVESHAGGRGSVAQGNWSRATGFQTLAAKEASVAQGWMTIADGPNSSARGEETQTKARNSEACGRHSVATHQSELASAEGMFEMFGDAQRRVFHMKADLTHETNGWFPLGTWGEANGILVEPGAVFNLRAQVVGATAGAAQRWSYNVVAAVSQPGPLLANLTVDAFVVTPIYENDPLYDVDVHANAATGRVEIRVTRTAAGEPHNIRWFALVEVAQVVFPSTL